jgi:hypothetical protein
VANNPKEPHRLKFWWKHGKGYKLIRVKPAKKDSRQESPGRNGRNGVAILGSLVWLGSCVLLFGFSGLAWTQSEQPAAEDGQRTAPETQTSAPDQQISGSISGTVVDQSGAVVTGALVTLTSEHQSPNQQVVADDGQFSFANVAPGPFQLTLSAVGLATQTLSGVLQPGENYVAPQISLHVATALTNVRVEPPQVEIAEAQIKDQEKQRVLAVVPNFYVSYVPDAVPLTSKQKFELAWRTIIDPVTFAISGVIAGVEQAENQFSGYGQGAQGYAKRFGASYGDIVSGTFIGSAILPSILKQDPRYFYKGTGSKRSRFLYAIANSVICKGDNRHWQLNYSNVVGSLAAGGISNFYYPKDARNRAGLIFENTAIKMGETAVLDVFQEFLIRKLTPKPTNHNPANP